MDRTATLLLALLGAGVLWALSRTQKGQQVAADIVGAVVKAVDRAKELIAGEEGLRLDVYLDSGGAWTIGYGHLVKKGERFHPYGPVTRITVEEADALFDADLREARSAVASQVKVPLTDGQRAALESFVFNVGTSAFKSSTLLRKINLGDYSGALAEFDRWVYDNGERVKGLENRRNREQEVFQA